MKRIKWHEPKLTSNEYFSWLDRFLGRAHYFLFIRFRIISLPVSVAVYIAVVFFFGKSLKISNNYFVILPVLVGALSFGLAGGIIAGLMALPLNLLLFALIGHPEFSPASKTIAEISGIIVGTAFGYLSDYFKKLSSEIQRRNEIEINLKHLIEDKDMLVHEVHHRVKNNLNIIKSLIRLQTNRTDDPLFIEQSNKLIQRIYTIALIHEQLFSGQYASSIDMKDYITALVENTISSQETENAVIDTVIRIESLYLSVDLVTPLGLIINEILTNILKHAFVRNDNPRIKIAFFRDKDYYRLEVADNGQGFDPETVQNEGLGLKLIKSLTTQLKGTYEYRRENGTCFILQFPAYFPNPGF